MAVEQSLLRARPVSHFFGGVDGLQSISQVIRGITAAWTEDNRLRLCGVLFAAWLWPGVRLRPRALAKACIRRVRITPRHSDGSVEAPAGRSAVTRQYYYPLLQTKNLVPREVQGPARVTSPVMAEPLVRAGGWLPGRRSSHPCGARQVLGSEQDGLLEDGRGRKKFLQPGARSPSGASDTCLLLSVLLSRPRGEGPRRRFSGEKRTGRRAAAPGSQVRQGPCVLGTPVGLSTHREDRG